MCARDGNIWSAITEVTLELHLSQENSKRGD